MVQDPNNRRPIYPPEAVPKKKKKPLHPEPQKSGVSSGTTLGPGPTDGAPPTLAYEGAPDGPLGLGSGALFCRPSDLANTTREALGHHLEVCFQARFPQEGTSQRRPNPQEFIARNTHELQESRVMRGSRCLPTVAPHLGEDGGLCICVDIPGLDRAASQQRL